MKVECMLILRDVMRDMHYIGFIHRCVKLVFDNKMIFIYLF